MNPANILAKTIEHPAKIMYLTGLSNYAMLHLSDGTQVVAAYGLSELSRLFPGFIRIHKSRLINPAYVDYWERWRDTRNMRGIVMMKDGARLALANRRVTGIFNRVTAPLS